MRPAHLHFLIYKPGFKTHISQVYLPDDPNIETDVQFGVTRRLLGDYVRHENEKPPAPGVKDPWFSLDYTFIMEPGTAKLPRPPIQDKAKTTEMRPQYLQAANRAPGDGEVSDDRGLNGKFPRNVPNASDSFRNEAGHCKNICASA